MSLKFNNIGKSGGATLHYNDKVISKVHYGGVLVYQNRIKSGTEFLSSPITSSTTVELKGVSSNWSNLPDGIQYKWKQKQNWAPLEGTGIITFKDLESEKYEMVFNNGNVRLGFITKESAGNILDFKISTSYETTISSITAI